MRAAFLKVVEAVKVACVHPYEYDRRRRHPADLLLERDRAPGLEVRA